MTTKRMKMAIMPLVAICIFFSYSIALADIPLENNVDRTGSDYASFNLGALTRTFAPRLARGTQIVKHLRM